MKDNEIISLFEIRDEHAIEALSDKYHPYCYKIAWNLLTNKEDSEECLNDTWFSVWSLIPPERMSRGNLRVFHLLRIRELHLIRTKLQ